MTWTTEKPIEEGYYWIKFPNGKFQIVKTILSKNSEILIQIDFGVLDNDNHLSNHFSSIFVGNKKFDNCHFSEKIKNPDELGEEASQIMMDAWGDSFDRDIN